MNAFMFALTVKQKKVVISFTNIEKSQYNDMQ